MDGRRRQTYFHDFYNYAGLARSVWLYSTPRRTSTDVTVVTGLRRRHRVGRVPGRDVGCR